jgi:hypothetical protein
MIRVFRAGLVTAILACGLACGSLAKGMTKISYKGCSKGHGSLGQSHCCDPVGSELALGGGPGVRLRPQRREENDHGKVVTQCYPWGYLGLCRRFHMVVYGALAGPVTQR